MFQKKYYLYLSQSDFRVLLQSLVQKKNRLIREGRFADCVDELQPFIEEVLPNVEQDNVLVTESMDVVINAKSYLS